MSMPPSRPEPITVPLDPSGARTVRAEVVDQRWREKDGRWYWRAREEHAGQRRDVSAEVFAEGSRWRTPTEAHRALMAYALGAVGSVPQARLRTVGEVLSAWTAHVRDRRDLALASRRALETKARMLSADDVLHAMSTSMVTEAALEDARDRLLRTHAGNTVANGMLVLRQAWKWAKKRGYVVADLPHVTARRKLVKPKLVGTPGEAAAILAHLRGWHAVAFRVIVATGARPGEAAALTRASIAELDQGWIVLEGKTGPRSVPLDPHGPAARGLRAELAQRPALAPPSGVHALRKAWEMALAKAGLSPDLTLYAWRRAAAIALRRAGIDVTERAAILGHGVDVHLESYDRAQAPDVVAAMARAKLEELPEGRVIDLSAHTAAHKRRA